MGQQRLGLEITELRLGLPGVGGDNGERQEAGVCGGGENRHMDLVVGWPPVCLHMKKNMCNTTKLYVKVRMDGAPILRKVDLSRFKGYWDLGVGLEKMFDCYGIGMQCSDLFCYKVYNSTVTSLEQLKIACKKWEMRFTILLKVNRI